MLVRFCSCTVHFHAHLGILPFVRMASATSVGSESDGAACSGNPWMMLAKATK